MGFFGGLGRLLQGRPVFEVPEQKSDNAVATQSQGDVPGVRLPNGQKDIPSVEIEEIDVHNDAHHMRIIASIKNHSARHLELDKIHILGTKREIDAYLKSGEEGEFTIYEGVRPQNTYQKEAWLDYKDETGDYFRAKHLVEFDAPEQDKTYTVRRIKFFGPIQDI